VGVLFDGRGQFQKTNEHKKEAKCE